MKVLYQCEICRWIFESEEEARNCEARGPARVYPVGMIYGGTSDTVVLAVAKNMPEGHFNFLSAWATRDNSYPDSLGEKLCIGGKPHNPPNPKTPAFGRMVTFLYKKGIDPIYVWDGKGPVTLEEFLLKEGGCE